MAPKWARLESGWAGQGLRSPPALATAVGSDSQARGLHPTSTGSREEPGRGSLSQWGSCPCTMPCLSGARAGRWPGTPSRAYPQTLRPPRPCQPQPASLREPLFSCSPEKVMTRNSPAPPLYQALRKRLYTFPHSACSAAQWDTISILLLLLTSITNIVPLSRRSHRHRSGNLPEDTQGKGRAWI